MPTRLKIRTWKSSELPLNWFKRNKIEEDRVAIQKTVKTIITEVKKRGDAAILEFTEKFDKAKLTPQTLTVLPEEIKAAYKLVTEKQIAAIKLVKEKLETQESRILHRQPGKTTRDGITVQTALRPLESVGCYVPGGQAAYPSTLIMTAIPAKVAGVLRVVVCSPPTENSTVNPLILVAADICGVSEIYKVGGVQAIAALAYGTESIKSVRKIVGPGSKFVTEAKIQVSQEVAIDMPAGPSEVLLLADESANARMIAADMISQAEHGADSVAGLITTSETLAKEVLSELESEVDSIERRKTVLASLSNFAFIITCTSLDEMASLANTFAPEHLEIITKKPNKLADKINTAGLILLGPYSFVTLSDYVAGTNHVLPTGGFGYTFSGLSVLDFTRRISIVESTKDALQKAEPTIRAFTEAEHLPNHLKALEARLEE